MSRPSVAVIGASNDRSKFGNKCVRAYSRQGFEVFPINPHADEIEGLPVLRTLGDLQTRPDRICIYLPPHKTRTLLTELASYPDAQIWFNPGSANPTILEEVRAAGIDARDGCSIVDIGLSPSQFP